ncbi:MAG: hypothetical protein HC888_12345 [Candidatus Competibacteraceae bacterium]|nr:hypothetical protein [Candidatus Competibacteraceae bacterium]
MINQGYLPEFDTLGNSSADGYLGPKTRRALQLRDRDLAEMPAPPKPWWESRRGRGWAKFAAGTLVGGAALFWSGAENIDAGRAVEIIYDSGPTIDSAIEIAKRLAEIAGLLLAAFGVGQSAVGAIKAEGPLDPTLVARVGRRELRLPAVVREPARSGPSPALPAYRKHDGGYWERKRGAPGPK